MSSVEISLAEISSVEISSVKTPLVETIAAGKRKAPGTWERHKNWAVSVDNSPTSYCNSWLQATVGYYSRYSKLRSSLIIFAASHSLARLFVAPSVFYIDKKTKSAGRLLSLNNFRNTMVFSTVYNTVYNTVPGI